MMRCAAAMRSRQIGKERRAFGVDAESGVSRAHDLDVLGTRLLHDRHATRNAASMRSIAVGTISAITRAPWLPPKTTRRSFPPTRARQKAWPPRRPPAAHRIAGESPFACNRGVELLERAKAGGDRRDARGQQPVGAAHDAVLLVQHRRDAAQAGGQQAAAPWDSRRSRRRPRAGRGRAWPMPCRAERQQRGGARQRSGLRPRTVALGMRCTARAGKLEMRGARIGGEIDDGAALLQGVGERLRREQMPAGSAGRKQHQLC